MEYIHKAKAEKLRTKVLSDQMEARRIKNKVRHSRHHPPSLFLRCLFRRPSVNVALPVSLRNDRASSPLSTRRPRSRYWSVPFEHISRYMISHVAFTRQSNLQRAGIQSMFNMSIHLLLFRMCPFEYKRTWKLGIRRIYQQRCGSNASVLSAQRSGLEMV